MKKINLVLSETEAKATVAGLKAAFDFGVDFYMFAPGRDGYQHGNLWLNDKRVNLALRVVNRIEETIGRELP